MLADWQRHKEKILSTWIVEHPGTRPFAWWQFDAPASKPQEESERSYLERHNQLTEPERNQNV
jgi:hypothetical protein